MADRSSTSRRLRVLAAASVLAAACGSSRVGNASPRISDIPKQVSAGGTAVTLDLATYVTDREGDAVSYAVVSGGGSFTGSTYTNTFATMGSYTVQFLVADVGGHTNTGSFDVDVTSAHFAVVNEDTTSLKLLDTATNSFVSVAANTASPTFAAGLADGSLVFQRGNAAGRQLWIYDPFTRSSRQVGDASLTYVTYRAKTSDDHIVLTTGTSPDTDLFVYNPRTHLLSEVSAVLGEMDGDALVNGEDLVFYERGSSGQADIYYYDPTTDTSTAVGVDPNDEQLLAVLPDDGIVFSRIGGGGEHDLFYFKRGTGVVEIGTNIGSLATDDKAFGGAGTGGQVVFTANTGTSVDLYFWSPTSGLATAIATGGTFAFEAIGPGNEVVYRIVNSGSDQDLAFYDLDNAATATLRNGGDVSSLLAITSSGGLAWAIMSGSGAPATANAASLVGTPATANSALASAVSLGGKLGNGDVVVTTSGGTNLGRFDASLGAWTTITGTGLLFGGPGLEAGDFVYQLTQTSQTDLRMWDDSATTSVDVSVTSGDDAYQCATADSTILFTRKVGTNTTADLFVWDGATETRLTNTDEASQLHDHTIAGTYNGSR